MSVLAVGVRHLHLYALRPAPGQLSGVSAGLQSIPAGPDIEAYRGSTGTAATRFISVSEAVTVEVDAHLACCGLGIPFYAVSWAIHRAN